MKKLFTGILGSLFFIGTLSSCDTSSEIDNDEYLVTTILILSANSINGTWVDKTYGTALAVNANYFNTISSYGSSRLTIAEYNQPSQVVYLQNASTASYYPNAYSRVRFHFYSTVKAYYCTEVYGKSTLEEAKADTTTYSFTGETDATCNGFTWSKVEKTDMIYGSWTDSYNSTHTINQSTWTDSYASYSIQDYSTDAQIAYIKYSSGTYSRRRLHFASTDTAYYCEEVYGKSSLDVAKNDTTTYTFTGVSDTTCNGFAWTKMERQY